MVSKPSYIKTYLHTNPLYLLIKYTYLLIIKNKKKSLFELNCTQKYAYNHQYELLNLTFGN